MAKTILIKDTHRGLWYEDGRFVRVLEAGRYRVPREINLGFYRRPRIEVVVVDVRERDLTIKGQEILTSDKVALRVSIIVQFRVVDPRAAVGEVINYEDRLYGDVQLAARRSLATMTLEEILTNRNRLSEDILADVTGAASRYGVEIGRADVKDITFPGNLQEIMNRVLTAERLSEAQLVEARTKAEVMRLDAQAKAEARRIDAEAAAVANDVAARAEADALRMREQMAAIYDTHPALLRLEELRTMGELARTATARLYIGFDKHTNGAHAEE